MTTRPDGLVVMSPSANLPRCVMPFWTYAHAFSLYYIIPNTFPTLLLTYQNIIRNHFSMLIETYFDKKKFHGTFSRVPCNFLNNIWTTPVVPRNSMELKQQNLKFHGIPWNFVQIQIPWNSMELFPYSRVPWNSMRSVELDKFNI